MPNRSTENERLVLARLFINSAREELQEYRDLQSEISYRQACEKAWAAIAQAVMYVHGNSIHHHNEYSKIVNALKKSGEIDLVDAVIVGDQLHSGGFYHGAISVDAVENGIQSIDEKIAEIEKLESPI